MRGVDIYRYQTVTSYAELARSVGFAWVKVTDGNAPAIVRGDAQVGGCRAAGIPVGGYHYAQRGDPVRQARVFIAELKRLNALDLAPALDLEAPFAPNAEARNFGIAFCREIARLGYRPAVYMSASWAGALRPDQWGIPNLVIWIAAYGGNDGRNYDARIDAGKVRRYYSGRYDVHQHTSAARVPGIRGDVDLNWALTGVPRNGTPPKQEEQDMTPEESRKLTELWEKLLPGEANRKTAGVMALYVARGMLASEKAVAMLAAERGVDVQELAAAVVAGQRELLEDVIREIVPDDIAEDVVTRLGQKLAEVDQAGTQ